MAEALMRGMLRAGLVGPRQLMATDVRAERLTYLTDQLGVPTSADNLPAVEFGEIVVLAVKPQDIPAVVKEIGQHVRPNQCVVSIAAGVPLAAVESGLVEGVPAIRVMPNTPCLVGEGMAALALGRHATSREQDLVARIFQSAGRAVTLPEPYLDAVTALSGSGPGFIALIVEALGDAGVRCGLPREVAALLAAQTTLGTARMILENETHPAKLKEMVASPGGTTIVGLQVLERGGLRGLLMEAVLAATERSRELGAAARAALETPSVGR